MIGSKTYDWRPGPQWIVTFLPKISAGRSPGSLCWKGPPPWNPPPPEGAQDAAVMAEVAIVVGRAPPDADGGQVRRFERRDLPLVHRVVRDAVQPDLAIAPGLSGRPLDAAVEVLGLAGRPDV